MFPVAVDVCVADVLWVTASREVNFGGKSGGGGVGGCIGGPACGERDEGVLDI